ncbi:MAG: hypothetical protein MRY72_12305 [Aquisalinus sp.]|nr:hypothetical protein [Aquisalinus sp.]
MSKDNLEETQNEMTDQEKLQIILAQLQRDNTDLKQINGDLLLSEKRATASANQLNGQLNMIAKELEALRKQLVAAETARDGLKTKVDGLEGAAKPRPRRKPAAKKVTGKG